jgi:hypothetical protein
MIYVVGTSHRTQVWTPAMERGESETPVCLVEGFSNYLTDISSKLGIDIIAEELSAERLGDYGSQALSVAKTVSEDLKISHLFCDLSREERRERRLLFGAELLEEASRASQRTGEDCNEVYRRLVNAQFVIREGFWISKLQPLDPNSVNILFVCGADHCSSFVVQLCESGIQGEICCPDWTELSE